MTRISMYQASVPRLVNTLGNLSNMLDKAQAHVDAGKIGMAELMQRRLIADMYPFYKQVQIACDKARSVVARLAGLDVPAYADDETTLAELTAKSLELAMDGTKTITDATKTQVAKEEIEVGGKATLTERAWGFEGVHVTDTGTEYPARFFIFRGTGRLNGALQFSQEQEGTGVPLQVKALADTSKVAGKDLFKFQRGTGPKVVTP